MPNDDASFGQRKVLRSVRRLGYCNNMTDLRMVLLLGSWNEGLGCIASDQHANHAEAVPALS